MTMVLKYKERDYKVNLENVTTVSILRMVVSRLTRKISDDHKFEKIDPDLVDVEFHP